MAPVAPKNQITTPELEQLMDELKMSHAKLIAADLMATAKTQRWEPAEAVRALLSEEVTGRAAAQLASRRKAAQFPTGKTLETWDPKASSIDLPRLQSLRTLEWIERKENLILAGPSGTGKTFFLEALGYTAIEQGKKVVWFRLEDSGILIRSHKPDQSIPRAISRILSADLIIIDDTGYSRSPTTPPKASTGS